MDTRKIASSDTVHGYIIINASDFDAATMTAYDGHTTDAPNGQTGDSPAVPVAPVRRRK